MAPLQPCSGLHRDDIATAHVVRDDRRCPSPIQGPAPPRAIPDGSRRPKGTTDTRRNLHGDQNHRIHSFGTPLRGRPPTYSHHDHPLHPGCHLARQLSDHRVPRVRGRFGEVRPYTRQLVWAAGLLCVAGATTIASGATQAVSGSQVRAAAHRAATDRACDPHARAERRSRLADCWPGSRVRNRQSPCGIFAATSRSTSCSAARFETTSCFKPTRIAQFRHR